jgi:hypothetical protein
MGRPPKYISDDNRLSRTNTSLRGYWREISRKEREAAAQLRAERKAHDKRRAKCRCEA